MKNFAASNHNIPEVARKILSALHYVELSPVEPSESLGEHGAAPSALFTTYQCKDAMISIASSARNKPVTVTIAKPDEHGKWEELLFHFDPVRKILLSARQTEASGELGDGR